MAEPSDRTANSPGSSVPSPPPLVAHNQFPDEEILATKTSFPPTVLWRMVDPNPTFELKLPVITAELSEPTAIEVP